MKLHLGKIMFCLCGFNIGIVILTIFFILFTTGEFHENNILPIFGFGVSGVLLYVICLIYLVNVGEEVINRLDSLSKPHEPAKGDKIPCPSCGSMEPTGHSFCGKCGNSMTTQAASRGMTYIEAIDLLTRR